MRLASIFLAAILTACGQGNAPPSTSSVVSDSSFVLLQFERFGCYGFCPTYSVRVHKSGETLFYGSGYVQRGGYSRSLLSPEQIEQLNAAVSRARLSDHPSRHVEDADSCKSYVTDSPSMKLTLVTDKGWTETEYYFGCPKIPAMVQLGLDIDRIVGAEKIVGEWEKARLDSYKP